MARKSTPPAATAAADAAPPNAQSNQFPVVGIGASAGGLSAYTRLLKALPLDTGMAFVLVQHLDPKHISLLPELMARATPMPVLEASDDMRVEPNYIYVTPPNCTLALLHGILHLMPRPDLRGKHMPINDFFQSLAQDRQNNAIGVILSGTASDGSLGLQAIKAAGGITFAQSEDSAEYSGMPHSAIATGHVDFVLPPEDIASELARMARHPYLRQELLAISPEALEEGDRDLNLNKIFLLLRTRTGIDFTHYKQNTIQRRIKRRMVLHQLDKTKHYVKFLQAHPKELDALFQDMLINVTSFFRDPETFDALKKEIFPRLMADRPSELPLRIWIPACSTGEEVYSVVMALFEFLGDNASTTRLQIFASDIDKEAIDRAGQGIYPQRIAEDVEPERLQRFFVKTASGYQICKPIRDVCVFAVQNVTKDPPFSRLDLICCRNLMIYLGPVLQKKVLHTFHYALRAEGYLMLGTSESIGSETDLFSLLDKKNKIYSRKPVAFRPGADFVNIPYAMPPFAAVPPMRTAMSSSTTVQQEAEQLILEKYGPPGVIINQDMQILQFRGQTGPYIQPSAGSASLNLLKMARPDLVLELRTLVQQAIKQHGAVRKAGVQLHENDSVRRINPQVLPLAHAEAAASNYLVLFEPGTEAAVVRKTKLEPDTADANSLHLQELENELFAEREYMQSIIEDQEATNEELQSANEEIQSTNEELQSTNEELETAKEELQSTNEELATIIEEHENRNQEVNRVNNDFSNLLASIELVIVILHADLRIRRFTPAAKPLLNLIDTDIGRPLGNIRPNFKLPDLEQRVRQVIDSMVPQSVELQDHDGHWYILRVRPYRTLDNRIEGAVLAFIGIDSTKDAERLRQALQQERRLAAVVRDARDAVTLQDFSGRILAWNRRAAEMYGYSEEQALQLNAAVLIADEARADMHVLWERLRQGETVPPCESWRRAKDGRIFKVWLITTVLLNDADKPVTIALTEREVI